MCIDVHILNSFSKLFHRFAPLTDIQLFLFFVLALIFLNMPVPVSLK